MPSIFKNLEFLTRVSVSCGFVHSQFSYIFPSFLGYPTWLITSKTRRHVAGCPNHWPLAQGEKYCEPTDVDFTLSDEAELGWVPKRSVCEGWATRRFLSWDFYVFLLDFWNLSYTWTIWTGPHWQLPKIRRSCSVSLSCHTTLPSVLMGIRCGEVVDVGMHQDPLYYNYTIYHTIWYGIWGRWEHP